MGFEMITAYNHMETKSALKGYKSLGMSKLGMKALSHLDTLVNPKPLKTTDCSFFRLHQMYCTLGGGKRLRF